MNDYRVIVINHSTGEIIEHDFPTLDTARIYEMGITAALGIVWDTDCEYYIEHHTEKWERVPDEDDDEDEELLDTTEWDIAAGYSDNAPCDNTGFCIGSTCKHYRNCTE